MDIYRIVLIGIISTVIVVLIKDIRSELAVVVALAAGVVIILTVLNMLTDVVVAFHGIVEKTGISTGLFVAVLKIIGVGYLTEFGANIAEDAGTKSIADKILFGGKVIIMVLALPVVQSVVDIIMEIL